MAISQSDAQKLLDNLEESKKKPELILTDLFIHGISGVNFLYQVYIDEKHMKYTKSCSLCGGKPHYEKDPHTGTYSWFHFCKGKDGKEHYYYCKGFKTQGDARRHCNAPASPISISVQILRMG